MAEESGNSDRALSEASPNHFELVSPATFSPFRRSFRALGISCCRTVGVCGRAQSSRPLGEPETTDWQDVNLDVMRAVAVLAVLAAHTLLVTTGASLGQHLAFGLDMYSLGQFGVLLFFVHTALVLMRSMERMDSTDLAFVGRFYVRRAFRIYPLSISIVILGAAFSIPPYASAPSLYAWHGWRWFVANLLLMQNVVHAHSISGPLWSLPFEVQMYLVLPFIYLWLRGKGFGRLVFLYGCGIALSCLHDLLLFLPCFLAGVLAYKLCDIVRPRFSAWLWLPTLLALVWLRLLLPWEYSMQGATLLTGLIIPLFKRKRGLITAGAAQVAKYSYGIYLWHTPILWLFYRKLTLPAWERAVLLVGAISLVPIVSYHLIENPIIQFGKRLASDQREPIQMQTTSTASIALEPEPDLPSIAV